MLSDICKILKQKYEEYKRTWTKEIDEDSIYLI